MSAITWLKNKCQEWNRIKLTKNTDGMNGWWVESSFTGNLPNAMIRELRKSLKSNGGSNDITVYFDDKADPYKESFVIRVPSHKGNNRVRVSYSYYEK